MKKILSLIVLMMLCVTGANAADKTIALVPGPWAADNATFAVYAFNSDTENAWYPFVEAGGAYGTQVDDSYTKIILVRLKPATAEGFSTENYGLNWANKWNQTADIDFTAVADQTVFTITGWGGSDFTAATPLDAAKAALQAAIDKAKAFNTTGLAEIIADAEAALADENATIESIQAAAATFEAGVKTYLKYVLNTAIPMVESLNAESLIDAINTAKAALANEDATAAELADALFGMIEPARPYIVGILGQTVEVCKPLGIDTSAAEAALSQGDEASTVGLALTLYNLTQTAIPAIQGVVTNLKAYMTTFSNGAAQALAEDFAKLETDITNGNITAVKNDIVTLMTNGKPYLQADIEKLEGYAEVLNSEAITADVAAMKKAVEDGSFANLLAAVEQFKVDFLAAAPGFVNQIKIAAAGFKDAGKTNAMEQLEAAIKAAEDAIAAEDATIVTVGLAIRNLIVAVKTHIAANSTYTIAGTKNLTGTENDWDVVEANNMTKSAADYMYEWNAENITINAENQPQFKVVITDIEGNQTWIPASDESGDHNWIITPYVVGGEGVFNITITYNAKTQEINVINKEWAETIAAAEALVDMNAVAVGKLLAAIEIAKAASGTTDDKAALQAAIDQFKLDNADQEKDETVKVATNGWKKFDGNTADLAPDWAAAAVNTYDGRSTQPAEVYEGSTDGVNRTGTIIYQDITGLTNGKYKVGFYGTAYFTPNRGFDSTMEEGATDVAYVFANEEKSFITAHVGTSFSEYSLLQFDVEVTDGNIKLGLGKEKPGTNWHTMQIYQLTWFTTAKEVFAEQQKDLKALVAEAETLASDENKTNGKEVFQAVLNAAKEGIDTNWYNIAEVEKMITDLRAAIATFRKANWFIDFAAGEYYIIDATSGLKMAAGHSWGTQGIVNEMGLDLILTPYSESRTVTIDSRVYNSTNQHFLGENLYMDSNEWGWALEYQGFGFYILNPNSGQYINIDYNDNLVMSDTPREFIIVTKDGVMEQLKEDMANATAENPVDATRLIKANNFNRNDSRNAEAWVMEQTLTGEGHSTNLSGGNNSNNCAEAYHTGFSFIQTISNAPAGLYKLTAQGFYRQDGQEAEDAPVFFIGSKKGEVPVKTGDEGNMSTASESFTNGLYTLEQPIEFKHFADGDLVIGVRGTGENQWVIFDNFKLEYCGPATADFYVAGAYNSTEESTEDIIFGSYWNPTLNKMTDNGDGTYSWIKEKVDLTAGNTIYYKVVADGDWDYTWGFDGNNADYIVGADGNYDVVFTFNPNEKLDNGFNLACDLKDGGTTGITTVAAEAANNGAIYNLNGQRVMKAQKGLFIINGRKQVVK